MAVPPLDMDNGALFQGPQNDEPQNLLSSLVLVVTDGRGLTEALPSSLVPKAKSTGERLTQLWETGKLNSIPKAAHAPR